MISAYVHWKGGGGRHTVLSYQNKRVAEFLLFNKLYAKHLDNGHATFIKISQTIPNANLCTGIIEQDYRPLLLSNSDKKAKNNPL